MLLPAHAPAHARSSIPALLALAAAATLAASASADIIGMSAGGIILEPNPPINAPIPGAVTAPVAQGFNEQQNVTLSSALNIFDLVTAAPAVLAPGTIVSSHFVYFDPAETSGSVQHLVGFDAVILGVIFDDTGMDSTHSLFGRAGLNYPGFITAYGFELATDSATYFSPNALRFTASAGNPGDHFRVITAGVPTPGTAALGMLGVLAIAKRRRAR